MRTGHQSSSIHRQGCLKIRSAFCVEFTSFPPMPHYYCRQSFTW
uniref:Uncharacterized protein n=1 Tax=Anguilla anguilla TaxID=7936 RepID=A0A0E9VU56_ANGAN